MKTDETVLSIRMSRDLRARLEAAAKRREVSTSVLVRLVLAEWLAGAAPTVGEQATGGDE